MNLKKIRIKKRFTQSALAEKVNLTNQAISNYETGIREPNLETLKRLATELECTVDELLEDDEDESCNAG